MPTLNEATGVSPDPVRISALTRDRISGEGDQLDRGSLVRGLDPILGGNYLRFTAFEDRKSVV